MFGFTDDMNEKVALVKDFCDKWIYPNLDEIDAGKCCPDYIWDEWCKILVLQALAHQSLLAVKKCLSQLASLCGKSSVRQM